MSVWIFQDDKQVKQHGKAKASYYVGWIDPEGKRRCKSCGPGTLGYNIAQKKRRKLEAELLTGTYQSVAKASWQKFRDEFDAKALALMEHANRYQVTHALEEFEDLIKPARMHGITTRTLAEFVAKRRNGRGLKKKSSVSAATINKELRCLRVVFRKAHRWGYLLKLPDFEFLKEQERLPSYIPPAHFVQIYKACDQAGYPNDLPCSAADWWRALLITGYMTGWRIGALLSLRRDDVDLKAGTALTRAEHTKGRRDQLVSLNPVVTKHLKKIVGFDPAIFPWNRRRRYLWEEFERIQKEAGIRLKGPKGHYGFHDLRRAFATMNADRLTADALQFLMQHKDYQTTQRYISIARQLNPAVENLFVPTLPRVSNAVLRDGGGTGKS